MLPPWRLSNLSKQCRPWWNTDLCGILSGSSLLAKVPIYQYPEWKRFRAELDIVLAQFWHFLVDQVFDKKGEILLWRKISIPCSQNMHAQLSCGTCGIILFRALIYIHTLCMWSEMTLTRLHGCAGLSDRRVAEIQIFEKTYLIVIKDETGLKFKMNDSTLFLIGSYAQKFVASYKKMGR